MSSHDISPADSSGGNSGSGEPATPPMSTPGGGALQDAHASSGGAHGSHGQGHGHGHEHVEHEFGAVKGGIRFHAREDSDLSSAPPTGVVAGADGMQKKSDGGRFSKAQWRRLRKHIWHRRWLRQYFASDGVLVREAAVRGVKSEELYLDLIVVAAVASLAHELRHNYDGWSSVENFILLFGALYSSWRTLMFLWNAFGTKGDLVDKFGVFLVQVSMAGIGLGAHSAFTNARRQVGVSSFLATAVPGISIGICSYLDPASQHVEKGHGNLFNQGVGQAVFGLFATLPYLIGGFLDTPRAAKNAYWVGLVLTQSGVTMYVYLYFWLHRKRKKAVRVAVNIESMVEKYGTLTLVVLGESLMALLFEGSELLADKRVDVGAVFRGVFLGVLIIYSMMTLYFNVDNVQTRGYVHAIRHNRWAGLAWSQLHLFYHMQLAGFLSTGIGFSLRDIGIPPGTPALVEKDAAKETAKLVAGQVLSAVAAHASSSEKDGPRIEHFTRGPRFLFSIAWMIGILASGAMGLMHKPGRRGKTKNQRIWIRALVAIALGVGMPFSNVSASAFLVILALVSVFFALSEFILIEMDRIGMLSGGPISSNSGGTSTVVSDEKDDEHFSADDGDESEEMDPADDHEAVKKGGGDLEAGDVDASTATAREVARVRAKKHGCRFKAIHCKKAASKTAADQI